MLTLRREVFGSDPQEGVALMRWAQQAAGLNDCELARRIGLSPSTVQEYREGKRPRPGWAFAVRWLRGCGFRLVVDGGGV